jgi:hypothetical protein
MTRKLVGRDVATEALGMTKEEFTKAVREGYFPRALILRFGDIEKYDLDGLLEYGRTGCIPFELKSFSGRAILRRILILEARLFCILETFELSALNSDGENPIENFLLRVRDVSGEMHSKIGDLEKLNLYEEIDSRSKDIFDLEERVDQLTKALLEISILFSDYATDLSSATTETTLFVEEISRIRKIKYLSAKGFFQSVNYSLDEGEICVDELLNCWEQKDIDAYLNYVENLASEG